MKKTLSTLALVAFAVLAGRVEAHEGDHWPTPYTAEQIRDAWYAGFWMDTKTVTAEGTTVERTIVLEHSADRVKMRAVGLDAAGNPVGDGAEFEADWESLRKHAEFPRARADRRRHTTTTPLGEFEGYLFRVDGESPGEVTEFFFSDAHPGPPLLYRTLVDGEVVTESTQVARATR